LAERSIVGVQVRDALMNVARLLVKALNMHAREKDERFRDGAGRKAKPSSPPF
jgi:hypothetical protein